MRRTPNLLLEKLPVRRGAMDACVPIWYSPCHIVHSYAVLLQCHTTIALAPTNQSPLLKSAHEPRCSKASIAADSPCERQCRKTDAAPPSGCIINGQTAYNAVSGQSSVLHAPLCGLQSTSTLSTALAVTTNLIFAVAPRPPR